MRSLTLGLAVCGALVLAGCNKSEPGGVTRPSNVTGSGKAATPESFKISAPTGTASIKQGASETFKIAVERGRDFKGDVELECSVPEGAKLEANPSDTNVSSTDPGTVNVTLSADKDAPVGRHTITVTGRPDKGEKTSVTFDVQVVKP
jgi:uncharacterized membrane protein